jgi:uncharacterized membrane protein
MGPMRVTPAYLLAGVLVALTGVRCTKSESPGLTDAGTMDGALSCTVKAPTACPEPPLRYAAVAPIIQERCVNTCHAENIPEGPWPLTDYQHVADWADLVRDSVLGCAMPPPDAGVPITDEERLAILTWIRCGFPE